MSKKKDDPIVVLITMIGGLMLFLSVMGFSYILSSGDSVISLMGLTIFSKSLFAMFIISIFMLGLARIIEILNEKS